MSIPKVFAMYLPQYHCIPENDEFWGKGFTDWVTVKNALPLFEGHRQPRVPLNENYYDLSLKENVLWQANLAKDHGIYGFGVYHYWFNNEKNLLTKPAEIMRDEEDLGVKYFFAWDNCLWKRSWSNVDGNDWAPMADKNVQAKNKSVKILIPYILGEEPDWKNHYNYVKTHFHSKSYEKYNNKPVFAITSFSKDIVKMCDYWDKLAKADGFDGMCFIHRYREYKAIPKTDFQYKYQPHTTALDNPPFVLRIFRKLKRLCGIKSKTGIKYFGYDQTWKKILKEEEKNTNSMILPGAFVDYDDSPRRGIAKAILFRRGTPEKFTKYFKELIAISKKHNKPYIFLTAWNEWGEGAYLEPDTNNGKAYLEALKKALA